MEGGQREWREWRELGERREFFFLREQREWRECAGFFSFLFFFLFFESSIFSLPFTSAEVTSTDTIIVFYGTALLSCPEYQGPIEPVFFIDFRILQSLVSRSQYRSQPFNAY